MYNDCLLEKYDTICNKVNADVKKIDSEPAYNEASLKTKVKSHSNEFRDFYDKKVLKVEYHISIDSALKRDGN